MKRVIRRTAVAVATAALLPLALTACSDDGKSDSASSATGSVPARAAAVTSAGVAKGAAFPSAAATAR